MIIGSVRRLFHTHHFYRIRSKRPLFIAASLISGLVSINTNASDRPESGSAIVEIITPKKNEIVQSQPVAINIKFTQPVDPSTFRASLNDIDVTPRFAVSVTGAQASLGQADGLRTEPNKKSGGVVQKMR